MASAEDVTKNADKTSSPVSAIVLDRIRVAQLRFPAPLIHRRCRRFPQEAEVSETRRTSRRLHVRETSNEGISSRMVYVRTYVASNPIRIPQSIQISGTLAPTLKLVVESSPGDGNIYERVLPLETRDRLEFETPSRVFRDLKALK